MSCGFDQPREEIEAGIDALDEQEREHAALDSALQKVGAKVTRTEAFMRPDSRVLMKLTWAELKALRQFGLKHFNG